MIPRDHPEPNEPDQAIPSWQAFDALAALSFLGLAHLVFYPVLQSNVFLYGTDTVAHDLGLLVYNWSLIGREGQLGLWNPYLFCGIPSLGTFAACPFYPLTWLFAFLPPAVAFNYQYILNSWGAGLWTYWAARWMGLQRPAAFFAGLVFMASGHFVTLAHAGHLQKFAAIAWIPLAFGAVTAALKTRQWRMWMVCGIALAAQLLASHTQIACYTILFLVPWTFWEAWKHRWDYRPHPRRDPADEPFRTFGFVLAGLPLAVVVAAGLSAAQMFPALETTPIGNRGGGVSFQEAAETSYPPLEFAEYLFPSVLGDNASGSKSYWGQWGSERIVSDYMGLLPLLLLGFAMAAGRGRDRWFWLAVIIVAGVLACGRYTPVFPFAFEWLPGLNRFRSPGTIMAFLAWPAAIVAAAGLQEFVARTGAEPSCRRRYLVILLSAVGVLGLLLAILTLRGINWPVIGAVEVPAPRRAGAHIATILSSLQRSLLFAILACGALSLLVAAGALFARGIKVAPAAACVPVFILAFMDPRLHESRYIRTLDIRPFEIHLFNDWTDSILKTLPQPVRGIETGKEYTNRMMTRGIGSLHGYHPVYLQEYVDLLNLFSQNHAPLGRLVFEQFILAPEGRSPGREYEKRASEEGRVLWLRRPLLLYAYFPDEIAVAADREELLAAMVSPDFNPYRRSYTLDSQMEYSSTSSHVVPTLVGKNFNSSPTARVAHYSPDRIELEVSSTSARPMVVAELQAPGWQWSVEDSKGNGKAGLSNDYLQTATVNHAFRAAIIPAGTHRITLTYRPSPFRIGLYLTVLTLLGLIASAFVWRRREAD